MLREIEIRKREIHQRHFVAPFLDIFLLLPLLSFFPLFFRMILFFEWSVFYHKFLLFLPYSLTSFRRYQLFSIRAKAGYRSGYPMLTIFTLFWRARIPFFQFFFVLSLTQINQELKKNVEKSVFREFLFCNTFFLARVDTTTGTCSCI